MKSRDHRFHLMLFLQVNTALPAGLERTPQTSPASLIAVRTIAARMVWRIFC
jgi:hypothetical protein